MSRHFPVYYLLVLTINYFFSLNLKSIFVTIDFTKTEFQTDNLKPHCDWLTLSQALQHLLRAPSRQNQVENSPKF